MRVLKTALVLSTLVGTAACGRQDAPEPADLAWLDTLELQSAPAAQAVVSPVELGMVHTAHTETPAPEPEVKPVEEPVRTAARESKSSSSSTRSSSSAARRSSGSSSGGSSGDYQAPAPRARTVEVKNTKRDAAIGAVVGAGVGAVAGGPRHRVKGAVIGAATGGLAGAVIGSTIDKSKRTVYDY
ncbi:MAG TPA: YMGG-like glycine zipper-containing protein [Longimicrobiaceae bacterium]|nr:YMGG-like glycine zipper-containing protein [Longimicrobiaceae bacterium]